MRPCRVCDKIPKKGYPKSRVARSDWICVSCSNKNRAKWWAKSKLRQKEAKSLKPIQSIKNKLQAYMPLLDYLPNTPLCPVCEGKLKATRVASEKSKPLGWTCHSCNQVILAKGI